MSLSRYFLAPLGLALALSTAPARADILVTISDGITADTQTSRATGNTFAGTFNFAGFAVTFASGTSNFPGAATAGTLNSTLTLSPSSTSTPTALPTLSVSVQAVDSANNLQKFTIPNTGNFNVTDTATVSAAVPTTLGFTGSALVNGVSAATDTVNLNSSAFGTNTASQVVTGTIGYTLAQNFTVSGLSSNVPSASFIFNSSVSTAAVPEPSSLVLTGLVAAGLGGIGIRRRRAA